MQRGLHHTQQIRTRQELIRAYIEFFKKHNHREIPSASLIPENDPTVLFTTAGMHPLVPFLLGQKHPLGKRLVSVQKCIRTQDIEEVGDKIHHTFFEMLGNWSLGDYFKKEAIEYSFKFLTEVLKLSHEKLAITVFAGDENAPRDKESVDIWVSQGIPKERIAFLGKRNNWWGPAGATGPCGPDTEMFYWTGKEKPPKKFDPNDERWIEIWNDVFMEYKKTKDNTYEKAQQYNVDTGMGVERTIALLNNTDDVYQTSILQPIIQEIEVLSGKQYKKNERPMRIIADHLRAATFILGDDHKIQPSNIGQGYIVRRLIRRAIRYGRILGIKEECCVHLAKEVINCYADYQELERNRNFIYEQLKTEEQRFRATLEKGLKKFQEVAKDKIITGKEAFLLFQSYGFPIEMTQELAAEEGKKVDLEEYNQEFLRHQDLSRTMNAGIFKSGLADESETTKKLHTTTHLLNEALRQVIDKNIRQKGSNITPERLRFDFNFSRKLTNDELKRVEALVNEKIQANLKIIREEIPLEEALESGAQAEFGAKYPELVSVYTILDPTEKRKWFSKEICTGPHVQQTGELGRFTILKEESVAAGIRRIKAHLES